MEIQTESGLKLVEGEPEPGSTTTDQVAGATPAPIGPEARPKKTTPKKVLPTNRMAFAKQLDTLRGWAIAGSDGGATNQQVAAIVGLRADTVTLGNTFFLDAKFLQKAEGGYAPTDVTVGFNQAHAWAPDTAGHKLAPALRESWFGKALLPLVQLKPVSETEALAALADAAGAGPEYRAQLGLLLDYLATGGLVIREGGQVRLGTPGTAEPPAPEQQANTPIGHEASQSKGSPTTTTGFAHSPEGQMQFSVNFRVTMSELAGWEPDRITAFFAGVAQVLAAKAAVEKGASTG